MPAQPQSTLGFKALVTCVVMAVAAIAVLPTTIVFALGMIPTAVAYFVDSTRERALGRVVLCLNFAGVLPSLLKLWQKGHNVNTALDIMTQPIMLAMALLPAAFGWLLYFYVPYLAVGIVRRKAEARIRTLERYEQELIDQWGPPVAGVHAKVEAEKTAPAAPEAANANGAISA